MTAELTAEQEDTMLETAREQYLEKKHSEKVECRFCGYEHNKGEACRNCEA
jgi:primosomal protein N'